MPQARFSKLARQVLRVDEEEYKKLVRELAERAAVVGRLPPEATTEAIKRLARLERVGIVLGRVHRGDKRYRVWLDIPLCQESYGSSRGGVEASLHKDHIGLKIYCWIEEPPEELKILFYLVEKPPEDRSLTIRSSLVAYISDTGEATTRLPTLYNIHNLLYKELGIGARPLLELARKAEEAGDKDMAGILKKVYAVLEASKDIIGEIERGYQAEVEGEVAERAVELLRRAKEAAREGDEKRLRELLDTPVIESGWVRITLGDIISGDYRVYDIYGGREDLKHVDVYDTILTVAEHFGLEVRRLT